MWKRPEQEPAASPPPYSPPSNQALAPLSAKAARAEASYLGAGLSIKGQISGDEDLTVEGYVEGRIELRENLVKVGARGRVKAEIVSRMADIAGHVEGNVVAEEQVVVRQSGTVRGNLTAPRVSLEDGAKFKGAIDMEPRSVAEPTAVKPDPAALLVSEPKPMAKPTAAGTPA